VTFVAVRGLMELFRTADQKSKSPGRGEQFEQTNETLRALTDSIPHMVWVADAQGEVRFSNKVLYQYTGLSETADQMALWRQIVHPADFPRIAELWAKCLRDQMTFEAEYRIRKKSGEYHWHLVRTTPLRDPSGKIVKWFGTATDIQEQKEFQEQQRFFAEASSILSLSLDYRQTLQNLANLAVERLCDWCAVEIKEAGEQHPRQIAVAHPDPKKLEWALELNKKYPPDPSAPTGVPNVIRTGKSELYPEIPMELLREASVNEEHFQLIMQLGISSAMVVPLKAQGQTIGAITLIAAESGRRYSQSDLQVAEEMAARASVAIENALLYQKKNEAIAALQRSNQDLNNFAAIAAHDLRAPLNSIVSFTQLLESQYRGKLDSEADEYISFIVNAAKRGARLIENLLTFARTGKSDEPFKPVDTGLILMDVRKNLSRVIEANGARITHDALPRVLGDEVQLTQLFQNLISNSIKFRSEKPPHIHIAAENKDKEWLLIFSDNGIGIPAEHQQKIFELFTRFQNKNEYEGTGLGLAIAKRIVEGHGGRIWVDSVPGEGTKISFTLPSLH